jgi:hypothetical protein
MNLPLPVPNMEFTKLASAEQIERASKALAANGITTLIAEDGLSAKIAVTDLIPAGAEVFTATSQTLATLGLDDEINKSGRYDAVRPKLFALDRATQRDAIRILSARPAFIVGSVHAVTENGEVLAASFSGSQLGPYLAGAGKVIWVVGVHKIVRNVEEGMRRIREYSYPMEDARLRAAYGVGSSISKLAIINREVQPERITMVLVKEALGF